MRCSLSLWKHHVTQTGTVMVDTFNVILFIILNNYFVIISQLEITIFIQRASMISLREIKVCHIYLVVFDNDFVHILKIISQYFIYIALSI